MTLRLRLAVLFAAVAFAGCKGPCRQLSERLCDCALNSTDKNTCLTRASNAESANPPTPGDDSECLTHLSGDQQCDCRLIDTAEGKVRCGLARSTDAVQPADAGT